MTKRIPPSEYIKQEISQLFTVGSDSPQHPLDTFIRQSARYMIQVVVEQEVTEFLGRDHYKRGERRRFGWRNGYEPKTIKTANGPLDISMPQVRATEEAFNSEFAKTAGNRSSVLEGLITQMYVRGLSTRDIEGMLLETFGNKGTISRSGVSKISSALSTEFDMWRKRELGNLKVIYLFLDAIYLPVRQGSNEKEGVLCAYGILEDGKKVLLHLALGNRESFDAWLAFLHEMVERGLNEPLLTISDGNAGLKKAVKQVFPDAMRQRCQVHKMRNILAKLPKSVLKDMKKLIQQVFYAPSYESGLKRGNALINRFKDRYPSAMECLEKDLDECLTYLKFPKDHYRSIRTTNLLERTFGEGKRRTKVIPRFPNETACLKLVYATLITASKRWHGIKVTPAILRQLDTIREGLFGTQKLVA